MAGKTSTVEIDQSEADDSKARTRPITMAILAMGGEGGGVLADWVVELAEENDWYGQSTSVPGVAQRTGATVYYVELFPRVAGAGYPVLGTMPTPGEVDIVVASELMEGGRAIQRGFCTPDRTTLIASTSRTYAMPERTAMGEGRVDSGQLIQAAVAGSRRFVRGDFARIAEQSRSVISAVLFGAIAGAEVLPFTREQFEDAIRAGGKGVEASLRAFAEGLRVAAASERATVSLEIGVRPAELGPTGPDPALERMAQENPSRLVGSKLQSHAARIGAQFPASARLMLVHGIKRTSEYQDAAYAQTYLDRVASLHALETYGDGSDRLTNAAARYIALWMTYEDTTRVAFHKIRSRRVDRVGQESRVGEEQVMQVHDFLHPQLEEITDVLPTRLGEWMLRSRPVNAVVGRVTRKGLKVQTTSVVGYTALYITAAMKPLRRRSLRFGQEQARIETWMDLIRRTAPTDYALACEIVECQQVVKGYGATHANGLRNFNAMMAVVPSLVGKDDAAAQLARLRSAALSDETGKALQTALAAFDR